MGTRLDVKTADGTADCYAFTPASPGPWPAVLLFQDGLGLRPELHNMAQRLADAGYYVLMPNLFYRAGAFEPFDPRTVWTDASQRDRLMALIHSVPAAAAMRDTASFLEELGRHPDVRSEKIGVVGYCMGGMLSFTAACTLPERVAAAASIHGGNLVTDKPDSPHLSASRIRARLYLGVADNDRSCTPEHQATLDAALKNGGVRYQMELNKGAAHGFAIKDLPVYDAVASEKHWERILALFQETLKPH